MWMDKPYYSWGTRERCSSALRPRILQTRERLSSLLAPRLLGQKVSVTLNSTQLCQPLLSQECSLPVFKTNYRWTHWQEPSISDTEAAETGWPQVRELLGIRCEFKSNLDYVVKHCLKAKPKKKMELDVIQMQSICQVWMMPWSPYTVGSRNEWCASPRFPNNWSLTLRIYFL